MGHYKDFDESTRRYDLPVKRTIRQKTGYAFMTFSHYASSAMFLSQQDQSSPQNDEQLNMNPDTVIDDKIASTFGTIILVAAAVVTDRVSEYNFGISPFGLAYETFTLNNS